ncbi:MAG: ABC transporter permease [Thaumarchaeota archaeon]|nr:ABC transporter permease [Nitrososphaerota archaeon]
MASFPLVNLWNKRQMIFHFAILNLKIRFKSTYLGFLWAALEPLFYFSILYMVFTGIQQTKDDFSIYLLTGIMLYHIFARGTSGGLASLIMNSGSITSLKIQKEFFPIVATVAIGLLAFVDVGVFFGLMPVFEFIPSWTIVFLPLTLGLLLLLILGLSYILSIITVYVKDMQIIWTIFVYALLFVSPIFWYLDDVKGILQSLHAINPLGQIIELAHQVVVGNQVPALSDWLYTTGFVVAIFFVGYYIFHRYEDKVTEKL